MIQYIYVFDTKLADACIQLGFEYSKSVINNKEVFVFQADESIKEMLSTEFANHDFIIMDKLIF